MTPVEMSIWVVALLVGLALLFDFMNGFHDAANSIATVVSTGVLKPQHAVALAAFFNFIAILIFQLKVAATVGKGTIDPAIVDHYVIFGALVGAIFWNVVTWWGGIPSSSSHALIGGLVGAALAPALVSLEQLWPVTMAPLLAASATWAASEVPLEPATAPAPQDVLEQLRALQSLLQSHNMQALALLEFLSVQPYPLAQPLCRAIEALDFEQAAHLNQLWIDSLRT